VTEAVHPPPPLRVLQSSRRPRATTNPYITQLLEHLDGRVHVDAFSWRRALTGRYDVFHVHWPEVVFTRAGRVRSAVLAVLYAIALARMRLRGTAVVRTVHNLQPHEHVAPLAAIRMTDRSTALRIRLNPGTPVDGAVRTIPHGHYRDCFARLPVPDAVPGRLLLFGQLRAYKGVEDLLAAFAGVPDPAPTLHVVGAPNPARYADDLVRRAATDPRVTLRLSFADDGSLAEEIGEAELVVLPYRELHNSGALLLALSLERPVLVPRNPVTDALAAEVGRHWVQRFPGALTGAVLERALADVRLAGPGEPPDLDDRDWDRIADAHVDAYREAVALRRRRRR
jgi:beta-1,4-mannosyltransferase